MVSRAASQATIIYSPITDLSGYTPDELTPEAAGICNLYPNGNIQFCDAGDNIVQGAIDTTTGDGDVLILNNTPYNLTKIQYTLPSDSQVSFAPPPISNSSIFKTVTLENGVLTFENGAIAPGQYFIDTRKYTDTSAVYPVQVDVVFTPVPESSPLVGLLAIGALSAGAVVNRQMKNSKAW
jgi:hypothetical protein